LRKRKVLRSVAWAKAASCQFLPLLQAGGATEVACLAWGLAAFCGALRAGNNLEGEAWLLALLRSQAPQAVSKQASPRLAARGRCEAG